MEAMFKLAFERMNQQITELTDYVKELKNRLALLETKTGNAGTGKSAGTCTRRIDNDETSAGDPWHQPEYAELNDRTRVVPRHSA
jgi:hypothetical protein